MREKGQLKEYKFDFPSRKETRFTIGEYFQIRIGSIAKTEFIFSSSRRNVSQ